MNLKPNLWTLLFVLAAGAWFYTYNNASNNSEPSGIEEGGGGNLLGTDKDEPIEILDIVIPKDYEIDAAKYNAIRESYKLLKRILGISSVVLPYDYTWDQIFPSQYTLERDEVDYIKDLMASDADGKIYMMTVMENFKGANGSCKPSVSMVFLGEPFDSLSTDQVGYNFVVPCPPLCKEIKGNPYDFVCE